MVIGYGRDGDYKTRNNKVLGNKRDLPGALDETGLIERMGLSAVQVNIIINNICNIINNIIKVNIFTIIVIKSFIMLILLDRTGRYAATR